MDSGQHVVNDVEQISVGHSDREFWMTAGPELRSMPSGEAWNKLHHSMARFASHVLQLRNALADQRFRILRNLRHSPVSVTIRHTMESFGARDERPKSECLRIIEKECSFFVGIYAHRYGFVPRGETKSITESEYDAAAHLPRLIYLINDDAPWLPRFIDRGAPAERLQAFKERLREAHLCKAFSNKDELSTSVAADLGRHFLRASLLRVDEDSAEVATHDVAKDWSIKRWADHRVARYDSNRELFLVHSIVPSRKKGRFFDIFIYLQRHKSVDLSDVDYVEFFLGRHWGSRIFTVRNAGTDLGLSTSAHGEFLVVCRVVFRDGGDLMLERYINFER